MARSAEQPAGRCRQPRRAGHVAARADERRVGGRHVTGRWADAHEELNEALRTPAARRQAGGLREALHVAENVEADVEVREAALAQPREQRRLGALARCDRNDERAERPARRVQRPHVRLPRSCVADLCARELQERVQRGDAQVERLVAVAEHLLEQLDEPPVLGEQPRPKALGSAAGSTANARRARASARGRGSQQQLAGARPLEEERAAGLHRGEARDRLGSAGSHELQEREQVVDVRAVRSHAPLEEAHARDAFAHLLCDVCSARTERLSSWTPS